VCPKDLLDALSGAGGDVRDLGTGGRGVQLTVTTPHASAQRSIFFIAILLDSFND
jgi:hypothetical protein